MSKASPKDTRVLRLIVRVETPGNHFRRCKISMSKSINPKNEQTENDAFVRLSVLLDRVIAKLREKI